MNRFLRVYGVTCVLTLAAMFAPAAGATTIVLPTDEQLIAKAPLIVEGEVVATAAVDRDGAIWTETTVRVGRALKGDAPGTITISEPGGTLDDRITKLFGAPEFEAGEQVLLFLNHEHGRYRVVDLFVGKFAAAKTIDGRRLWTRDDLDEDVTLLDASLRPIAAKNAAKNVQRDAAGFEQYVVDRTAGREGVRGYGVENPVLARTANKVQSDFTLISEPEVYRWFRFNGGNEAVWYSGGTQSGYNGGGVSELQTAMSVWTSYAEAKILYSYAGVRTGSFGGLSGPNGVNEVLFNDPKNEISGTYSASSGGVVGTGGFNGVASGGTWTATFAGDASHPAGPQRAYEIREGNLTIQDGVTPGNGIPSRMLAEIVAHEFGHTLGFGHSASGNALMYASVTGLGPSLRTDDQVAARWLYPNGTNTEPPPQPTAPVAAFTFTPSSGSGIVGETNFIFTDQSTGTVTSRTWNFGDGKTATTATAAHVYAAVGTYTVRLSVTGGGGTSQTTKTVTVAARSTPVTPNIAAAFDVSTASASLGSPVLFTDRSTGGPTNWSWSFGDGATSTSQNPSHAYAAPGIYTVALTASNASSTSIATRSITVSASTAYRSVVSVATQTGGVGGTSWRTELSLVNAGAQGASVSLLFLPNGGGSVIARSLFLSPKQSVTYANVLLELFDITNGAGALAVEAASAGAKAELVVNSRTFTTGTTGTYGQAVPDVTPDALTKTLYIAGMDSNAAFRTNVGIVNRTGSPVGATLTLYNSSGANVSTKSVTLPANSFQQQPLSGWFPTVDGRTYSGLTLRILTTTDDALSAYASVVDNATQDPVYIQAVPARGGTSLIVPVVGRAPGANGTFWRSDVTLYNPTDDRLVLSLRYGGTSKTLALNSGDTGTLADILDQFGQASGSGALQITWNGNAGPVVTSRTYTSTTGGGTYGQSIDPVASFKRESFVPGLRNDHGYRSNVGFVNGGTESETFTVLLLSPSGNELARKTVTLAAGAQSQSAATALFPNAPATFTLHVTGDGNAKLFAYGSMVDNRSGDPVFFAGN